MCLYSFETINSQVHEDTDMHSQTKTNSKWKRSIRGSNDSMNIHIFFSSEMNSIPQLYLSFMVYGNGFMVMLFYFILWPNCLIGASCNMSISQFRRMDDNKNGDINECWQLLRALTIEWCFHDVVSISFVVAYRDDTSGGNIPWNLLWLLRI